MLVDGVDELIQKAKRELIRLSTECEQEVERAAAPIREKYEREMATFRDSLAHLEAVKANHSRHASGRLSNAQKQRKPFEEVQARNNSGDSKFPVLSAVREIVGGLKGEYSLDDVYKLFDKKHPGIRETLNRTSIHRAVNLLVKSGKVEKVGLGKYKNREQ